jgi:hypothetical protein
MGASTFQTLSPTPATHPTLGRRILRMSAVWAVLGAVMGASVGMEGGGIIGAIAGMMAGIVELAMLGAIFAVVGGTPEETVLGAVAGLLAGLAFGVMRVQAPVVLVANFGLVVGAIAGATLRAYFRLLTLPCLALGRLLHRHQRPAGIAGGHDGLIEHQPFVPASSWPYAGNHPVGLQRTQRSKESLRQGGGRKS